MEDRERNGGRIKTLVVVPWHDAAQIAKFCEAWAVGLTDGRIVFQQDVKHEGCGATKNRGVESAVSRGADTVIVLDDDCFPAYPGQSLDQFILDHEVNLARSADVELFKQITTPASRGTPYHTRHALMPVAASIGLWVGVGDYDAIGQLAHGPQAPMTFDKAPIYARYFPLCGMNIAFHPQEWLPWCWFIEVPRFDDIWMGWLWQKEAYWRGCCFRLDGPMVMHARQSDVWSNLREEAKWLEASDGLWARIAQSRDFDYTKLRKLLPV